LLLIWSISNLEDLRSQNVTFEYLQGVKYLPYAFTQDIDFIVFHNFMENPKGGPDRPPAMLDKALSEIYETEVGNVNRAVKRNTERFPEDFYFQLTQNEAELLVCQSVISKQSIAKSLPYAFTREGANMLSAVLRTKVAAERSVQIMRAFSALEDKARNAPDPLKALNDPSVMRKLLLTYSEKVLVLEETVSQQKPKVDVFDQKTPKSDAVGRSPWNLCY